MKIIVSMDERGWIVAKNAQGDILEEYFFKTDDETDEEIRAWGYQRLVHAYPTAQIVAGEGIDPQEIEELQKAHGLAITSESIYIVYLRRWRMADNSSHVMASPCSQSRSVDRGEKRG
jgi:hypothetical protein